MNDPQEALRRMLKQMQSAGGGGGRFNGPPPRGAIAGAGLVAALVIGGVVLNASLFNGVYFAQLAFVYLNKRTVDGGHRAIKYTRYEACKDQMQVTTTLTGCTA